MARKSFTSIQGGQRPLPGAYAQSESGRIVGTVTDATGAAIPQATVTLVSKSTGLKLTGTSTASGEINIPAVPAGDYTATVSATGFQSQSQAVTVAVTTSLTLTFNLKPGEATTTVEVTGAAALVDTSNATLGETIEGKQITELPLNGRNALNLALLTPGVTHQGRVRAGHREPLQRLGRRGNLRQRRPLPGE